MICLMFLKPHSSCFKENGLFGDQSGTGDTSEDTTAGTQRDEGGTGSRLWCGDGREWLHSGQILKVRAVELTDTLGARYKGT